MRTPWVALGLVIGIAIHQAHAGLDAMPDLSNYATKTQVPPAASATPPATALDGNPGTSAAYARADHTHAARVQRTVVTTANDGTYTWEFARPIVCAKDKLPPITYMVEDTGSPVVVQVIGRTWTSDGVNDTHTQVTVRAYRARTLPATLLALSALVSYDVFGIAAGAVKVNLFAADPTQ